MSNKRQRLQWFLFVISVLIGAQRLYAAFELSDRKQAQLDLTIRCVKDGVTLGEQIPIEFKVLNTGTTDYTYLDRTYDRSGRMPEYQLTVKDVKGQLLPDPRKDDISMQGGLSSMGRIGPGKFFTKTIMLNQWVIIREPGTYEVTGQYGKAVSPTLKLRILPPRKTEIKHQITQLKAELESKDFWNRNDIYNQLMFTGDPDLVPFFIDQMYAGYLLDTKTLVEYYSTATLKGPFISAAKEKGLATNMNFVLDKVGCTDDEWTAIIRKSLAPDNPRAWQRGALFAQVRTSDHFTSRLIEIASDKTTPAETTPGITDSKGLSIGLRRQTAISALAMNRTDKSVEFLRSALSDSDPSIRQSAERAIQTAYFSRGISNGQPLKPDDFKGIYAKGPH